MYSNFGNMGMNPYSYMGQQNYENKNDILNHSTDKDKDTSDNLNIIFVFKNKYFNVQATKYTKFSELSRKFCSIADIEDERLNYLVNSHILKPDDNRTLDELDIKNNRKIEVLIIHSIIGG